MANKNRHQASGRSRKIWGFIVVWLVLFLIVKSMEKILMITAVGAIVYWGSKALKGSGRKDRIDDRIKGSSKSLDPE